MDRQLLISDKWRPKTLEDLILPKRVRDYFSQDLSQNIILHGHYGIGKTSLARILIGKYTKSSPHIEINSSFYTSIDILRGKIDEFCSKVFLDFETENLSPNTIKYVFLDEFDRTSTQYQDALKAYIEDYSTKNVRFILSTNHLSKISEGIRSRFIQINLECQNVQEERSLKIDMFKKIWDHILPSEGLTMAREDLVSLIKRKFPDFRSILVELEFFKKSGQPTWSSANLSNELLLECYDLIYDRNIDYEKIYFFISDKFGADRVVEFFDLWGQRFILWHLENKKIDSEKLFKYNWILSESQRFLQTSSDPLVVAVAFIGRMREISLA